MKNSMKTSRSGECLVDGNYEPSNCRWTTSTIQQHNRRISPRNKSGYTGVFWDDRLSKWLAYGTKEYKRKYLGLFVNKLDAARERDSWAIEVYGKDAKLNLKENII